MSYITQKGTTDANNGTTTPLNNGQTFTGVATDVSRYSSVVIAVKSDQDGLVYVDFSPDGTNWDSTLTFTMAANVNEVHRITITRKFFRLRIFNNSGSNQTYLRAQTLLGSQQSLTSSLNSTIQSDADAVISRSVLTGSKNNGEYENVPVTQEGHLEVAIHNPLLPFGSLHAEKLTPVFQTDAVYGINPNQILTTTSASGSAIGINNFFVCQTGTTIGGFGTIQSRKRLRYKPGQGMVSRFTAMWSPPVNNSIVIAGVGTAESGFYVGLSGTNFGILQSTGGVRAIVTLTVTTGSTTTNNYNVTLNGVTFNVPATNNSSTVRTAYEISLGEYTGWRAEQRGSTVVFVSDSVGQKSNTFTLAQAGGGTPAAGTFVTSLSGQASNDTFIPQTQWNGDKLDGTGASGVTIDTQKGNIFEIHVTYLGFGPITFKSFITPVNSNNPDWVTLHTIRNPNNLTTTNVSQPSFPFTMAAYSAGSTTNVGLSCASFAGFVEGDYVLNGPRQTYERVATNTVGSVAGTYYNLFTVRNDSVFKNRANQSVIQLVSMSAAHGDNTPMIIYLIRNATLTGTPNFTVHSADSCTYYDEASTTSTITDKSQIIVSLPIGANGGNTITFPDALTLQPGETVTLAARAVTGTSPYTIGSINVREDQ